MRVAAHHVMECREGWAVDVTKVFVLHAEVRAKPQQSKFLLDLCSGFITFQERAGRCLACSCTDANACNRLASSEDLQQFKLVAESSLFIF